MLERSKFLLPISRLALLSTLLFFPTVYAQDNNEVSADDIQSNGFAQCIERLKTQAQKQNIDAKVVATSLEHIAPDAKVIEYDRRQPEFSESFANYLGKRVNKWRVEQGRALRKKHHKLLMSLQQQYGIPAQYLVAFWGLETNFGAYKGKMSTIRSLTTLACDQRRSEFFTDELMQALKLVQREKLDPQQMVGSWAGAIGHTQFMPSAYLKYAVDGDNDGHIDLWNSVPDALTSAANFLKHLGWKRGYRWGREVVLPADFDYHLSGIDKARALSQWRKLGVSRIDGKALPTAQVEAALLLPAGHTGPAFLTYGNFNVIMGWNHSQFYAIAVGRLAERIAGAGTLHTPPPPAPNLSAEQMLSLQQKLSNLGFDVGKPDGIMGPSTAKGISDFQQARNMIADGFPHKDVFAALGIDLSHEDNKSM